MSGRAGGGGDALPFGDRAFLVRGPAARALLPHLPGAPPFILGYAAGESELLVEFDPRAAARAAAWLESRLLERRLAGEPEAEEEVQAAAAPEAGAAARTRAGAAVLIPVIYGGAHGPDLEEAAARLGVTPEEVVRRHTARPFPVAFFGFAPGFAYLGPVPELALPRRDAPRVRVPAGAVGLAAGYTAVYPREGPGGWHLIGRTPVPVFDPLREPPVVFGPSDLVRFRPAREDEARPRAAAAAAAGDAAAPGSAPGAGPPALPPEEAVFLVEHPGVQATLQDVQPRRGRAYGYPPSGALDRAALVRANALAGNPPCAAGLEVLAGGLRLRALRHAVVALDGELEWELDGRPVPTGAALAIAAGEVLRAVRRRAGWRGYLAVRGGLAGAVVGGSRSTDVRNGIGGYGRPLAAGDHLWLAAATERGQAAGARRAPADGGAASGVAPALRHAAGAARTGDGDGGGAAVDDPLVLEAVPLGELGEVPPEALVELAAATWRVGLHCDRTGVRLEREGAAGGAAAATGGGANAATAPSQPVTAGLVQWPPGGGPILLLRDHPTTGGYPRAAVLTSASLDAAGQLGPGRRVRFRWVDAAAAQARAAAWETLLFGPWRDGWR